MGGAPRRDESSAATSSGDRFHVDAVLSISTGVAPTYRMAFDGGSKREIRDQHRVAGADAVHDQSQVEGRGAAAEGDGTADVPTTAAISSSKAAMSGPAGASHPDSSTRSNASRSAGPASGGERKMRDKAPITRAVDWELRFALLGAGRRQHGRADT